MDNSIHSHLVGLELRDIFEKYQTSILPMVASGATVMYSSSTPGVSKKM